jgi:hypothetical protein
MTRLSPRPAAIDPRHVPRKPDAIRVTLTLAAMAAAFLFLLFH